MKEMVHRETIKFSRPKLLGALEEIQKRYPFHSTYHCISLVHSLKAGNSKQKAYDGSEPLFDRKERRFLRDPLEFSIFNREFNDLYFREVYERVCEWSPLRIGRVRLFLRAPKSCMHMHTDDSPRYHIALTTNDDCSFFFKEGGAYHIPANGHLYTCDTTKLHTFFNAGETPRVHIVFDTIEWRFLRGAEKKGKRAKS
jgi:Aspartyl/Asparaginyl beta-hydroxylase